MGNNISKATSTSGRLILAVSFLIISSRVIGFELNSIPLIEQGNLTSKQLEKMAIPVLFFLLSGHFINWSNDQSRYLKESNKEVLNGVKANLDKIDNYLKEMTEPTDETKGQRALSNVIGNFKPALYSLKHPVNGLFWFSKFSEIVQVYIQHLLIPVFLCLWALWLLVSTYCNF